MCLKKIIEKKLSKKKIIELKQSTKSIEEYQRNFKEHFNIITDRKINNVILKQMYYDYNCLINKPSAVNEFLSDELWKIYEQIKNKLDDKDKYLLNEFQFLQSEYLDECGLESFIYGFSLGSMSNIESLNYMLENKIILENLKKLLEKEETKKQT